MTRSEPSPLPSRVVVAVLTYRRPDLLAAVLPRLIEQVASLPGPSAVLVVDNDPGAGARGLVADHPAARYVHEPNPGIAAARNRALTEAIGTEALVFIDDDETPAAGWLDALLRCWRATGAAAVAGPVESRFDVRPDAWVLATTRFTRRTLATGTDLRSAATNNLLLDLGVVERLGLRFDETFGLTGGEDTAFTHDLVAGGGRIVWCDEAVVVEQVPAERITRRWVLLRDFRSGTSWSRMRLVATRSPTRRALIRADLAARGTLRLAGGGLRMLWGIASRDVTHRARGASVAAGNAGLIAGALGHRYDEYRR